MSEQTETVEAQPETKNPAQGKKKKPKKKATVKRKQVFSAKLTSESLAALFDRGHLIIESAESDLKLRLDRFDMEEDLENLDSAQKDLQRIIENLDDDLDVDDEDEDFDDDEGFDDFDDDDEDDDLEDEDVEDELDDLDP